MFCIKFFLSVKPDIVGEKPCEYDEAGQGLHKLLKKKRVAHQARDEPRPDNKPKTKSQPPAKRTIKAAREGSNCFIMTNFLAMVLVQHCIRQQP